MDLKDSPTLICTLLLALFTIISSSVLGDAGAGNHISHSKFIRGHQGQPFLFNITTTAPSDRFEPKLSYKSNLELERSMKSFARRCENISRLYSIGESVMGFPLWVLEISNHPGQEEPKPSFKFVGNVHGDEPVGRELLLYLAEWLCTNYMKDPLATLIVESLHLHLLPSMNPDGFVLKQRGNANNIDLNRDFPDQFFDYNNKESLRQAETKAIMKWIKKHRFTASASLHGGALVANYPWDGTADRRGAYSQCPDDETFRYMAEVYSKNHYNMSNSSEFVGGITNGAFWYPLYGGMQDWNYIHGGCLELTLEISDEKWPTANEIPLLWKHNRISMLQLVATVVKTGVHGRVMSSSGQPLPAVIKIAQINHTVKAGNIFGDYHRLLVPGHTYEVTASMPGYLAKSVNVTLSEEKPTYIDFTLDLEKLSNRETNSGLHRIGFVPNISKEHENDRPCNSSCRMENESEWGMYLQRKYLRSNSNSEAVTYPFRTSILLTLMFLVACVYIISRCRRRSKSHRLRQR